MLIKQEFEVDQPIEKVWEFCQDIPNVASCLPGANLTDDIAESFPLRIITSSSYNVSIACSKALLGTANRNQSEWPNKQQKEKEGE